jgi:hypothetical protein
MPTVMELMKQLKPPDKAALMIAFEQNANYIVRIDGILFIGVNVIPSPNIKILDQKGVWSAGYYV